MQAKTIKYASIAVVIILTGYFLVYGLGQVIPNVPLPEGLSQPLDTSVRTPKGEIRAYLAANPVDRENGLSGRDPLAVDEGMLFVFPNPGLHGFWMKDMLFAIDIIWMDEERTVTHILSNVSPDTYPEVFMPPAPVRYVLELTAGGADMWGIATGTRLYF